MGIDYAWSEVDGWVGRNLIAVWKSKTPMQQPCDSPTALGIRSTDEVRIYGRVGRCLSTCLRRHDFTLRSLLT